mgnify:CR=1 FL=1
MSDIFYFKPFLGYLNSADSLSPLTLFEEVIKERNVWGSKDVWDPGDYLQLIAGFFTRISSVPESLWRFWNVRGEPLEY